MSLMRIFSAGATLFTMLFGAGNIIFPLILGRSLQASTPAAMLGFLLTAVVLPLVGFLAIMQVKGSYKEFLKDLGSIPAFAVATLSMTLLGPIGAIPRCIALAHADMAWYFPQLPVSVFSVIAATILWLCSYTRSSMLNILSKLLGPIKILSLLAIAVIGLLVQPTEFAPVTTLTIPESLSKGLFAGYGTLDLLAVLFFSQFIYTLLAPESEKVPRSTLLKRSALASLIAGILMTAVYLGFATVAVMHGSAVTGVADDTLLSALASLILGSKFGIFANITIIISCLTTAIALTGSFAEFLSSYICKDRLSYQKALLLTIIVAAFVSNFKFDGVMQLIIPPINLIYPALIAFAFFRLVLNGKRNWLPVAAFFTTLVLTGLIKLSST
jgi:LIVCS family branched-chain amino acid:cation transporter